MAQALTTEPIPLVADGDGVMRVRGTRVTLETILAAFAEGATAEEIAQQYPSVSLADVYQVTGCYLRHPAELEPYLVQRRLSMRETRAMNESRWPRTASASDCSLAAEIDVAMAGRRELQ